MFHFFSAWCESQISTTDVCTRRSQEIGVGVGICRPASGDVRMFSTAACNPRATTGDNVHIRRAGYGICLFSLSILESPVQIYRTAAPLEDVYCISHCSVHSQMPASHFVLHLPVRAS
jgi:hypothetical protein